MFKLWQIIIGCINVGILTGIIVLSENVSWDIRLIVCLIIFVNLFCIFYEVQKYMLNYK